MSQEPEKTWKILELYSGIGGMHYASKGILCSFPPTFFLSKLYSISLLFPAAINVGPCEVVFSVDVNNAANEVYRHNFPTTNQQARNIISLSAKEINRLKPDVIMMSPPCQPFTRTGLKLDVNDPRCASFLHLVDIFPHLESVEYVLMENVVGFETSAMRDAFTQALQISSFHFREFILSPESLNIPNSRNRYYLIARKRRQFQFGSDGEIVSSLPNFLSTKSTNDFSFNSVEQVSSRPSAHQL